MATNKFKVQNNNNLKALIAKLERLIELKK